MVEQKEHHVDDLSPAGLKFILTDSGGRPIEGLKIEVKLPDGSKIQKETDSDGIVTVAGNDDDEIEIKLLEEANGEEGDDGEESEGPEEDSQGADEDADQQDDAQ